MPSPVWIVVANGSRARLFQRDRPHETLREVMDWVHPQTRQHHPTTPAGHRTSGTRNRSGLAPRQSPQEHERVQFAREVGHWLDREMPLQHIDAVVVFASNPFLGELLAQGNGTLRQHVRASHALDLTHMPLPALDERLQREHRL